MADYRHLVCAVLFPNLCGWFSRLIMVGEMRQDGKAWYQLIKKPSWTPRNSVFGPVWMVLYTTMGCASYVVYHWCDDDINKFQLPLTLYGLQLILNFMWNPIFFSLHWIKLAFFEMLLLDVTTVACIYSFYQISTFAALLMLPYIIWLTFASYLNFAIWRMNVASIKNKMRNEPTVILNKSL